MAFLCFRLYLLVNYYLLVGLNLFIACSHFVVITTDIHHTILLHLFSQGLERDWIQRRVDTPQFFRRVQHRGPQWAHCFLILSGTGVGPAVDMDRIPSGLGVQVDVGLGLGSSWMGLVGSRCLFFLRTHIHMHTYLHARTHAYRAGLLPSDMLMTRTAKPEICSGSWAMLGRYVAAICLSPWTKTQNRTHLIWEAVRGRWLSGGRRVPCLWSMS